mgnify:CR=1 FL=1
MKIYLDNCALQRPLDDQSYLRIRLEAEAVVEIIELVEDGDLVLLNSAVLEYELQKCADLGRVEYGMEVLSLASDRIRLSDRMVRRAKRFQGLGMEGIDALHLAAAEANPVATPGCSRADRRTPGNESNGHATSIKPGLFNDLRTQGNRRPRIPSRFQTFLFDTSGASDKNVVICREVKSYSSNSRTHPVAECVRPLKLEAVEAPTSGARGPRKMSKFKT